MTGFENTQANLDLHTTSGLEEKSYFYRGSRDDLALNEGDGRMKSGSYPHDEEEDQCAICHETGPGPAGTTDLHTITSCGHRFHTTCIIPWLRQTRHKQYCPLCRVVIDDMALYFKAVCHIYPSFIPNSLITLLVVVFLACLIL